MKNINEIAWNKKVEDKASWTIEVSKDEVEKAKKGIIELTLGTNKLIPLDWFPSNLKNKKVLCLASGGGQQAPIFAALGCDTTVLDISDKQLEKDKLVATRDNLNINIIKGDMRDLSMSKNETFDIVFTPVSLTYIENTKEVFKEVYRVLNKDGIFMLGCVNPYIYTFDANLYDEGIYKVVNKLPFNSLDELNEEEQKEFINKKRAIEYSHTLDSILGNMTIAGFNITGFFESNDINDEICNFFPKFYNIKADKSNYKTS